MNLCECGKLFPEECAGDCVKAERDRLRALVKEMASLFPDHSYIREKDGWGCACKTCRILSRPEVKEIMEEKP